MITGIFWLLWVLVPLVAGFSYGHVHDTRMLQESSRQYVWIAVAAAIWLAAVPFAPSRLPRSGLLALVVMALAGGAAVGVLGFHLVHTAGDSPSDGEAAVTIVQRERYRVRLRVSEGPHAGLEFTCSNARWESLGPAPHRVALHRGPHGLWWGELQ